MTKEEQLRRMEFCDQFGITPDKCAELMNRLAAIVDTEVEEVIKHADFYMNPLDYCNEEQLKEEFGEDWDEKEDEDDDGYINLYSFKKSHSAADTFQRFISYRTRYGGYTSALDACDLMGIKGWRD